MITIDRDYLERRSFLPHSFLGLPQEPSDYAAAEYVILPVPYDLTTSYRSGTRHGPQAIIEASKNLETFDPETGLDVANLRLFTMPELEQHAEGPEAMIERIERAATDLLQDGKFVLSFGGEHTITIGLVRAHLKRRSRLSVLQIDAHADLRDSYNGCKFSHACTMRRLIDSVETVSVGVRSVSSEELELIRSGELPVFFARDIVGNRDWIQSVVDKLAPEVYLTIDLDGFDPSVFPAVGTPEPGGLDWYSALALIRAVASARKIIGADIVELSPRPGDAVSDFAAAKLALKILAYVHKSG